MIATDRATLWAVSWDPSIIWTGAYLAGALLVGALAVELFRRYIRSDRNERLSASDQLAHFRSLYEQGTLSEEEFNSLRSLLGEELRRSARKTTPAKDAQQPSEPAAQAATGSQAVPQTTDGTATKLEPRRSDHPTPPPETGIKPA